MQGLAKYYNKRVFDTSIIATIAVILCYVTYTVGLLDVGYNFTDYYQIIDTKNDIENLGFFDSLLKWCKYEIYDIHRWRLNYRFCIHIQTALFGTDYTSWNIARLFNAVMVFILWTYIFLRLRLNILSAVALSLMVILGYQTYTFYRFGPNITYALIPFSIGVYGMIAYYKSETAKPFPFTLTTVTLIIAFLSKETMALVIPSFLFLHYFFTGIPQLRLKGNSISLFHLALFILLIGAIMLIGGSGTGYAGIDSNTSILSYPVALWTLLTTKFIITSSTLLVLLILLAIKDKNKALFAFLFFSSFTFLQVIIYHKSGFIAPRYYYPMIIAFPLTIGLTISELNHHYKSRLVTVLSFLLILISLLSNIKQSKIIASIADKVNYTSQFSTLINDLTTSTDKNSSILIGADPAVYYEWVMKGIKSAIDELGLSQNVEYYAIENSYGENSKFMENLKSDFLKKASDKLYIDSLSEPDYTIIISRETRNFSQNEIFLKSNLQFDLSDKLAYRIGHFTVYKRNPCYEQKNYQSDDYSLNAITYRFRNINDTKLTELSKNKEDNYVIESHPYEQIVLDGLVDSRTTKIEFCTGNSLLIGKLSKFNRNKKTFTVSIDPEGRSDQIQITPIIHIDSTIHIYTELPPLKLQVIRE